MSLPLRTVAMLLGCLVLGSGCAPSSAPEVEDEDASESGEDELGEPGFDRNRVLSDAAMTDWQAMTPGEIQAFLSHTPYGGTSVLAGYMSGGKTAAQAIADAAETHHINPLLILTRAQMEQSLIGKSTASKKALDFAFGCGCPDGQACSEAWRGFHKQADCMASHMRSYLDDLEGGGSTIAGFAVGKSKKTLDGLWVTPKNAATAALYTYTPWVGQSGSGNLGHFQIWKRFAAEIGYAPSTPSGCPVVAFPSGLRAQSIPSDAMSEAYATALGPLGLPAGSVPSCFLDPMQLVDPASDTQWSSSSKVATNFTFRELIPSELGSRQVLVDPELVKRLQSMRSALGTAVKVEDAFRSPERQAEACQGLSDAGCKATLGMSLGRAAFVSSSRSTADMLDAAKNAGATTCFATASGVFVDVSTPGSGCPRSAP